MIKFDYTNLLDSAVYEEGVSFSDIEEIEDKIEKAKNKIKIIRETEEIGFFDLPYDKEVIQEIKAYAEEAKERFKNFVVLGIGGSALGAIAIHRALNHPYHNLVKFPRMFFMDNVDPDKFSSLLEFIKPEETLFNVITKSGSTTETISNFLIARKFLEDRLGKKYKDHIIVTTDPKKGFLREISEKEGYKSFSIPENVGGRYSVLSPVGLLSAAISGVDIEEMLSGAKYMDKLCKEEDIFKNPAYFAAILLYLLDCKKGKNIHVLMPYSERLEDFADWFRQLWAESLGKDGIGPTPIKALGVTDQHSQIQLYMEGPNNKVIIFMEIEEFEKDLVIPSYYKERDEVNYLLNHRLSELINKEKLATEVALTENKRPNCSYKIKKLNPFSLGALFFLFEVKTAFIGFLYGINPFNQPGVEEGKKNTYALMGRSKYRERKDKIQKYQENRKILG